MAINEKILAEFDFSTGEEVRIELTASRQVHIHVDSIRLEMSIDEFLELGSTVNEAHRELAAVKNF